MAVSVAGVPGRVPSSLRISRRLISSTSTRYVKVTPLRNTKYAPGSGTKPSVAAGGVKGKITPISTPSTVVTVSARLGRLRKGSPVVRMTKRTSVWVASDSTNQPVWNSASEARKTHSSSYSKLAPVVRPGGAPASATGRQLAVENARRAGDGRTVRPPRQPRARLQARPHHAAVDVDRQPRQHCSRRTAGPRP